MNFLLTCLLAIFMVFPAMAGFEGLQEGTSLKLFNQINCGPGLSCSRLDDKFYMQSGLGSQTAATVTTITSAQCGETFYNAGAVQIELPEASAVLGCRLTFVTANASNFDINPDDADQILIQTNAAGDAMRNATLGNSITIQAISATQWTPIAVIGTWSDIN